MIIMVVNRRRKKMKKKIHKNIHTNTHYHWRKKQSREPKTEQMIITGNDDDDDDDEPIPYGKMQQHQTSK